MEKDRLGDGDVERGSLQKENQIDFLKRQHAAFDDSFGRGGTPSPAGLLQAEGGGSPAVFLTQEFGELLETFWPLNTDPEHRLPSVHNSIGRTSRGTRHPVFSEPLDAALYAQAQENHAEIKAHVQKFSEEKHLYPHICQYRYE